MIIRHRKFALQPRRSLQTFGTVLAVVLALVATVVACSPATQFKQLSSHVVQALWYSGNGSQVQQGTAAVDISLGIAANPGDFTLDLDTEKTQGAGPAWTAATWSAASAATLFSFRDPRTINLAVSIDGAIDGPSAGGLMAATILALSSGFEIQDGVTMTGTINPDGSIGMVAGVPAKIRAAQQAGLKKVLVPKAAATSIDPATNKEVNVVAEGARLGVEVVPVTSLYEALAHLTGKQQEYEEGYKQAPPIAPAVLSSIASSTTNLNTRNKQQLTKAKKLGMEDAYIQTAEKRRLQAQAWLDGGKQIEAYAQQWQIYSDLSSAMANKATTTKIKHEGIDAAATDLLNQIDQLTKLNSDKQASVGGQSATNIQQMVGIPDVLTWGTSPQVALEVYRDRLANARDLGRQLPLIAEGVGEAEASIEVGLDQNSAALMASGAGSGNESEAASALAAYTDFLTQTGDANMNYFEQVWAGMKEGDDKSVIRDRWFSYAAADTSRELSHDSTAADNDSLLDERTQLSLAVSYYIDSAQMIVEKEILDVEPLDAVDRRVAIANKTGFEDAVASSTYVNGALLELLGDEKIDTSYAHWGVQWGEWLTSRPPSSYPDSVRLGGLAGTWHASIQLLLLNSEPIEALTTDTAK